MRLVIRQQLLLIPTKLAPSRFLLKNDGHVPMLMGEAQTMVLVGVDLAVAVEMVVLAAKAVADFRRNLDVILPVDAVEVLPLKAVAKFKLPESF